MLHFELYCSDALWLESIVSENDYVCRLSIYVKPRGVNSLYILVSMRWCERFSQLSVLDRVTA